MKRILSYVALLTAIVLIFPVSALAEDEQTQTPEKNQVLLVCNENNGRTRLEELIRACGISVDSVSETEYRSSALLDYAYLVTTINVPYRDAVKAGIKTVCIGQNAGPLDGVDTAFLTDAQVHLRLNGHTQDDFIGSAIVASTPLDGSRAYGSLDRINGKSYPFAVLGPNAAYIPWYAEDGLSTVMLGGLIRLYFEGISNESGKMYVALDEIYPFSDLDMFRRTVDLLDVNGIPFIVRVMPVYENFDYPAFLRFTQVLLYAQSKGGTIVLRSPLIQKNEYVREAIETRMARAKAAFASAGIELLEMNYPPLEISTADIQRISSSKAAFSDFPIDTMICYRLFGTTDDLEGAVSLLNSSWLTVSNYKANFGFEDSVYVEKEINSDYIFRAKTETSLETFFSGANRVLVIIVGISVTGFVLILIIGNRIYRKKFYKKQR